MSRISVTRPPFARGGIFEFIKDVGPSMEMQRLNGAVAPHDDLLFVAGASQAIRSLETVLAEIAPTEIPVLLVGESGTGKEMFARRVHRLSAHLDEPLVRIQCAAAKPATFSTELGLDRGGNGSGSRTAGGTIFLDEVSELDPACQRDLLSALPDGNAGVSSRFLCARVICTTSRNLDDEMRAGRFRKELFYRINGVCLRLPPLRDRKDDIPLLADFFLTKHAAELGKPRPSLSPRILEAFSNYSWPGNIRELENAVKKFVILGDEDLATNELIAAVRVTPRPNGATGPSYSLKAAARAASHEAERELILKALARTRWNRKRAAQELQISYKSLLYKLKQIGLPDTESSEAT